MSVKQLERPVPATQQQRSVAAVASLSAATKSIQHAKRMLPKTHAVTRVLDEALESLRVTQNMLSQ